MEFSRGAQRSLFFCWFACFLFPFFLCLHLFNRPFFPSRFYQGPPRSPAFLFRRPCPRFFAFLFFFSLAFPLQFGTASLLVIAPLPSLFLLFFRCFCSDSHFVPMTSPRFCNQSCLFLPLFFLAPEVSNWTIFAWFCLLFCVPLLFLLIVKPPKSTTLTAFSEIRCRTVLPGYSPHFFWTGTVPFCQGFPSRFLFFSPPQAKILAI